MTEKTCIADVELRRLEIKLPYREVPEDCYRGRHVEVNRLSQTQATAFRGVGDGLILLRAKLVGGKDITSGADVLRWILEKVHAAVVASENTTDDKKE